MTSLRLACLAALLVAAPLVLASPDRLPQTELLLGDAAITAEVADDDNERSRGLMFRDSMAPDEGMIFVFEDELPLSFWMKNTRIALDILYFDAKGRLVSIQRRVPPCVTAVCPTYPSDRLARYALELNAGRTEALNIALGTMLCERGRQLTPLPACEQPLE